LDAVKINQPQTQMTARNTGSRIQNSNFFRERSFMARGYNMKGGDCKGSIEGLCCSSHFCLVISEAGCLP
jgi:hypothetical protein